MTYEQFRREYERQHPASVPRKIKHASEYPVLLRAGVLIMFVCAALLSGAHTVPTIRRGLEEDVAPLVGDVIAVGGFFAIELAIFVSASLRRRSPGLAYIIMGVTFVVALVANVVSTSRALASTGDGGAGVVAFILGIGVPLIALASGEMFVHMSASGRNEGVEAASRYRDEQIAWDERVNTEWVKHQQRVERKLATQAVPQLPNSIPFHSPSNGNSNGNGTEFLGAASIPSLGHRKSADARAKVEAYFAAHPDELDTVKPLELAARLEVGKSTVYAVIGDLREQAARQAVVENGSGTPK
jgi:hypothetical protein